MGISNKSVKAIAVLSSGSLAAQVLTFLCSPLLTRLYTAEDIGAFSFVLAIISMFSGVVCLRYDVSIITTADDKRCVTLTQLCLLCTVVISAIVALGAIVFLLSPYGMGERYWYAGLFVFPLLLISGLINVLNAWNNREKRYGAISKAYVKRSIFQNGIMVFAGLVVQNAITLLFGQLIGQLAGVREQQKGIKITVRDLLSISRRGIAEVATAEKNQAIYSAPATFLNAASYSLVNIVIGALFGMAELGIYSISYRVLGVPLSVFSSNIAKVHCKDSQEEIKKKKSFFASTIKTVGLAIAIIAPITIVLILFSPAVCSILFGASWYYAGVYIQIFAPLFALRFLAGSIGFGFFLAKKQWVETLVQAILLAVLCLVSIISQFLGLGITEFLMTLSLGWSVVYLVEIIVLINYSKRKVYC